MWLTFQALLVNHGVGSLGHRLMQGITAHLIQPAGAQSSLLFVGAKCLNQRVNLKTRRNIGFRHQHQACSCLSSGFSYSEKIRTNHRTLSLYVRVVSWGFAVAVVSPDEKKKPHQQSKSEAKFSFEKMMI